MLATVWSATIVSLDALKVGLPDAALQESCERVLAAIKNSDFDFPVSKILLNLAPADLRKEGPSFDLPMAVGILAVLEQVDLAILDIFCL